MKIYFFIAFVLSFLGLLAYLISYAYATVTIRSGSCSAGEVCLFSLWNLSNSHAAQCSYYANYSVCTDEVSSANLRQNACLSSEHIILSFFQSNDTHIEKFGLGNFTRHVCVAPQNYTCTVKTSCSAGQSCMGTVYDETNSHFADCNFYSRKVCCGNDNIAPTISNESINATAIYLGETVRFTANVTDELEVSKVIITIKYPNGSLTNYTTSKLSGDLYFLDFTDTYINGYYTWTKTYANDTTNNFTTSSPDLQFRVRGNTYNVGGYALDSLTGSPITTGTVTAIVKETGDRGEGTISDGVYSVNIRTNLDANMTSFSVGIIFKSDSKMGYRQFIAGTGPLAQQTQNCSVNQWYFAGDAVDASTGSVISSGTVNVNIQTENTTYSNSTGFSNGAWDIYISPCLISGGLYTFEFLITGDGKQATMYLNQVAK